MSEYDAMSKQGEFIPYSSPLGIPGSSYQAQVGKRGEQWAIRLVKGREVLEEGLFDELNGNKMIAFIIQNVAIPMINPYQISQSVKALIRQVERGPITAAPATPSAGAPVSPATGASAASSAAPVAPPSTGGAPGDACPRCRRPIEPNFYFCPYCSKELRSYNCPGCQQGIRLDFVMCPYCGIKI